MDILLQDIVEMPPSVRKSLINAHITTSSQLLDRMAWPRDRIRNIGKLEYGEETYKPWIVAADLLRIASGKTYAAAIHLAMSGVVSDVKSLGEAETENLVDFIVRSHHGVDAPSLDQVVQQVETLQQAGRSAAPLLIWDLTSPDSFSQIETAKENRDFRISHHTVRWFFAALAIFMAVLVLLYTLDAFFSLRRTALGYIDVPPDTAWLFARGWSGETYRAVIEAMCVNSLSVLLSFSALAWFWLSILPRIMAMVRTRLASSDASKRVFLAFMERGEGRLSEGALVWVGRASLVFLSSFLLVAAIELMKPGITSSLVGPSMHHLYNLLLTLTALVLVREDAGVLAGAGRTWSIRERLAFHRYLLYRLSTILLIVLMLASFLGAARISTASAQRVDHWIIKPLYEAGLRQVRSSIESIESDPETPFYVDGYVVISHIDVLLSDPTQSLDVTLSIPDEVVSGVFGHLVSYLIFLTVGYALAAFLLPFLMARKIRQSLTFIVLAIISSALEGVLTRILTRYTGVSANTISGILLLFFVVIFSAVTIAVIEPEVEDSSKRQ